VAGDGEAWWICWGVKEEVGKAVRYFEAALALTTSQPPARMSD
jgi:hypothetical protein